MFGRGLRTTSAQRGRQVREDTGTPLVTGGASACGIQTEPPATQVASQSSGMSSLVSVPGGGSKDIKDFKENDAMDVETATNQKGESNCGIQTAPPEISTPGQAPMESSS